MNATPIIREVEGRLQVEWPVSPWRSYEVSAELIQQWVDHENDRRALVAAMSSIRYVCDKADGLNGDGQHGRAVRTIGEIARVVLLTEFESPTEGPK